MAEPKQPPAPISPNPDPGLGYEPGDANLRRVALFAVALTVIVALIFGAMVLIFNLFYYRQVQISAPPPPLLKEANPLPPNPRLQRLPAQDVREMRAEEDKILNSYGWVDESAGVTHLPIDRAIELTLERGLPTRPQTENDQ